jgi:hypothetical protein
VNGRFQPQSCTRCGTVVGEQDPPAQRVLVSAYQPAEHGPAWTAVSDWTAPEPTGAVLCDACTQHMFGAVLRPAEPARPGRRLQVLPGGKDGAR